MGNIINKVIKKTDEVIIRGKSALCTKKFGGKEVIVELVLAAAVIALVVLWKTNMGTVVSDMINSFKSKITSTLG